MKVLRLAPLFVFSLLLVGQQADLLNSLKFRQIRTVSAAAVRWRWPVFRRSPTRIISARWVVGVFKTTDSGLSWVPVSDGQFKTGSVGALAAADPTPT